MLDKFITKESLPIIVIAVILAVWFIFQSNYFATRLQLSELKTEVLQQKVELMTYSDTKDKEILDQLDAKYEKILHKLDQMKGN